MNRNLLRKDMTILFQGDSITDCGRERNGPGLGGGYVAMVAARLWAAYPELNLKMINRGISGNRAKDLEERWEQDCMKLKPDLVSIMIGINDTWRHFDANDPTSAEEYHRAYASILERTKKIGDVKIVVCEPFLLPDPPDRVKWRTDLDPKIQAARDLARTYADRYVPLDGIFAEASVAAPCSFWTGDGVHPTHAGHGLIADAWISRVTG